MSDLDLDLETMSREELIENFKNLRQMVRKHRDSTGHELCWYWPDLWDLLPEHVDVKPEVPEIFEFIHNCTLYRRSLGEIK